MKPNELITSLKQLLSDRPLIILMGVFTIALIAYVVYIAVALRPNDLQVAVHYSAFGEASFYRDKWYYFINYIVLAVIMAVCNTTLVLRLHAHGKRQLAVAFLTMSLVVLMIVWIVTASLLRIAFL